MSIGKLVGSVVERVKSTVDAAVEKVKSVEADKVVAQTRPDGFEANADRSMPKLKPVLGPAVKQIEASMRPLRQEFALKEADRLMKEGKYAEARKALDAVKDQGAETMNPWRHFKNESVHSAPGSTKETIFKNPAELEEAPSATVARKLSQLDQAEKMSKALGRTVDPTNVNDVKAYFDAISKPGKGPDGKPRPAASTAELRGEFATYVNTFYQHTGGLNWPDDVRPADRANPAKLNELLNGSPPHPRDVSGRAALDCEGHSYLAAAVFGGNPRFDVTFAGGGSHLSAVVFEKGRFDEGFTVNTLHEPVVNELRVPTADQLRRLYGPNVEAAQSAIAQFRHGKARPGEPEQYVGKADAWGRDLGKVNGVVKKETAAP
ncbi:MAG: hypothetical protein IAE78_28965 [Myxococcus sp.]|nr:hypothetical protein [Myxococcus sp.]